MSADKDAPESQQEMRYAIPGHDEGGRLVVFGNKNAKQVVFFCGGWPDDCNTFAPLAQRLATDNPDLLCGVTCLPGYDDTNNSGEKYRWNAFSQTEIVASLQEACKVLRTQVSSNANASLTGIFHDWGCVYGAMLVSHMHKESPRYFSSVVFFDIMPPLHNSLGVQRSVNIKQAVVTTLYTSLFAVSHTLQRYISFYVALPVLGIGVGVLNVLGLLATGKIDSDTFQATQQPKLTLRKMIYMQYPYFNIYKGLFLGDKRRVAGCHLPVSLDETPVLYMYGLEKNMHFHNDNMLAWLIEQAAKDGSKTRVIAVPKAGHWLYLQQPDVCFEAVKSFLAN